MITGRAVAFIAEAYEDLGSGRLRCPTHDVVVVAPRTCPACARGRFPLLPDDVEAPNYWHRVEAIASDLELWPDVIAFVRCEYHQTRFPRGRCCSACAADLDNMEAR